MKSNSKIVLYRGKTHILSHFFATKIIHFSGIHQNGNIEFNCAEQAYQAMKALILGNRELYDHILRSTNPAEQKRLGGSIYVVGKEKFMWDTVKTWIIFAVDKSKFGQNEELQAYLSSTGNKSLLENVPDRFWGIGGYGNGLNCAGKILQRVRSNNFPDFLLIGDSMIRNVQIGTVESVCLPGATSGQVCLISRVVANLPSRGIILHCGVNDLVTRENECGASPISVAKKILKHAHAIASENNIFVFVVTVLPRPDCDEFISFKLRNFGQCLHKRLDMGTYHNGLHLCEKGVSHYKTLLSESLHSI